MTARRSGEQGFMLLGVLVAVFLMLLALSIAAPTVARQMRREKEERAVEDGRQYIRAIRVYYRKFGHYPTSMEQLEKTNNIRFLRQHYIDPLTGKDDWRLIHVGENKTQVMGFFGQPLPGLPGGTLGGGGLSSSSPAGSSPAGGNPAGPVGGGFTTFGASLFGANGGANNGSPGAANAPGGTNAGAGTGANGATGTPSGSNNNNGLSGLTTTSGGGPIMGVGLNHNGEAMISVNDQSSYDSWEFLYDPRSEPRLTGQTGINSTNANQLGSGGPLGGGSSMNGNSGTSGGSGTTGGNSGTTGGSNSGGLGGFGSSPGTRP